MTRFLQPKYFDGWLSQRVVESFDQSFLATGEED
jgi:hypothetical protein